MFIEQSQFTSWNIFNSGALFLKPAAFADSQTTYYNEKKHLFYITLQAVSTSLKLAVKSSLHQQYLLNLN